VDGVTRCWSKAKGLQAAVGQFLPEPLRELLAVPKFPPIAASSAHGFLAVYFRVATGGAPQALGKRQRLVVLARSVNLHRLKVTMDDRR
jgi:hypothetical protein